MDTKTLPCETIHEDGLLAAIRQHFRTGVAMLYLVTEELLVEAHEVEETHWSVAAFFLGFLLFLVIEMLVEN